METKSVRKGGEGVGKDEWNESDCCIRERMVGDAGSSSSSGLTIKPTAQQRNTRAANVNVNVAVNSVGGAKWNWEIAMSL